MRQCKHIDVNITQKECLCPSRTHLVTADEKCWLGGERLADLLLWLDYSSQRTEASLLFQTQCMNGQ